VTSTMVGVVVATACAVKPQFGRCVAAPLLWGLPRRALLTASLTSAAWAVVGVLVLTPGGVVPYIGRLQWFGQHAATADAYDGLGMASLYVSWTPSSLHPLLAVLSTILVVAGLLMLPRRQGYHPTARGLAAATALATLLLPYSHHYDAVALIPALLSAWDGARSRWETATLGAGSLTLMVAPLIPFMAPRTPVRLAPIGLLLLGTAPLSATRAPGTHT